MVIFDIIEFSFNCCFNLKSECFNLPPTVLLTLIFSVRSSNYVASVETCFYWSTIFDNSLFVVSFIYFVSSDSRSVSDSILTSSFTILFDYLCFLYQLTQLFLFFFKY